MRQVQRFDRINVSQPGDHALIEQHGFERRFPAAGRACQGGGGELLTPRVRSERAQHGMGCQGVLSDQVHEAKASRIVEDDVGAG